MKLNECETTADIIWRELRYLWEEQYDQESWDANFHTLCNLQGFTRFFNEMLWKENKVDFLPPQKGDP